MHIMYDAPFLEGRRTAAGDEGIGTAGTTED